MENVLKWLFSGLTIIFTYCFGGLDNALISLLVFFLLDYITGLIKAYKKKKLNSKIGVIGILKKLGMLCMVAVGSVVDHLTGDTGFIRTSIIYYLVANEGLSIIENLGEIDVLVPEFLKDKLEQLKNKEVK